MLVVRPLTELLQQRTPLALREGFLTVSCHTRPGAAASAAICAATGRAAVADDTGLEVDALGGAPGVFAARYAGEGVTYADNRAKLLAELAGVAEPDRTARFTTVAMVVRPDGSETVVEGVCEGLIAPVERGARGFGYDAVFIPVDGDGRTFAEMSDAEKNAISHRGRAFVALAAALR